MPLPAKFQEGGSRSNGDVVAAQWWTAYRDKQLDGLVAHGLSENLDVLQALERINSASANVTVAGAGGLPSLDVGASQTVSGEKGSQRTTISTTNTTARPAFPGYSTSLASTVARGKAQSPRLGPPTQRPTMPSSPF